MLLNRKCNNCNAEYYVCRYCEGIGSWKNVCCSKECFMEIAGKDNVEIVKINEKEVLMEKVLMRGETHNGITHDIIGYDLEFKKLDCTCGVTHTSDEFKFFYVTPEEIADMMQKASKGAKNKANAAKKIESATDVES